MEFNYNIDERNANWINGNFGVYSFKAKMLNASSSNGTTKGRVNKLFVYSGSQEIIHYDGGWYTGQNLFSLYHSIVEHLEHLEVKKESKLKCRFKKLIKGRE